MTVPNEADDSSEHTPLLATTGDTSTKVSYPVAGKLVGMFLWPGSSICPTNSKAGHQNAHNEANSPKTSSQLTTAFGSPVDQSAIHLETDSGSSAGTTDPSEEAPAKSGNQEGTGPEQSGTSHPRGIETTPSWGVPAGLEPRKATDENVLLFRQAVGINVANPDGDAADPEAASTEHNRKLATGIYGRILRQRRTKTIQYNVLNIFVNTCHVVQILVGASLTALGSEAATHKTTITALGATNTILAGIFALLKGQGLPDRLHKDAIEYRRVQDWIEETDALLVSGVVGRDRKEIGLLIETAFKKYNAVQASEENNKPENYVHQQPEATRSYGHSHSTTGPNTTTPVAITRNTRGVERVAVPVSADLVDTTDENGDDYLRDGNSVVRLDLPALQ